MPALILAAALASAAPAAPTPAPSCEPPEQRQATAPMRAVPHPLDQEPDARRMHAVVRRIGGCAVVDVAAWRGLAEVWEYRLAGAAIVAPRPAGSR
jgi:hypothetical protein